MRQVAGFLEVIDRAHVEDFYHSLLSYGTVHGVKLPSLNEFLGASLGNDSQTTFDPSTDKFLEQQAVKRLEERRRALGK